MSNPSWLHWLIGGHSDKRDTRPPRGTAMRLRPCLNVERLEDRTLPSSYTATSVSDLIADINAANMAGGSNTITLVAGKTFSLTAVNNTTDGATGLPVIAANNNLTIVGNGDTIERSTAKGTTAFRLLDLAGGASLTLDNLTLQGGLAQQGGSANGGAIYNQGTLILSGVTVQNNTANGSVAAGGGIYSSGSLILEGGTTVKNNHALGEDGSGTFGSNGGDALGGGVYVAGGTATLTGTTLASNTAQGGPGGPGLGGYAPAGNGGRGAGGALYVAGGTVTLTGVTLSSNTVQGGHGGTASAGYSYPGYGGYGGSGVGGGLDVAGGTVNLFNVTVVQNSAKGGAGGKGSQSSSNGPNGSGGGGGIFISSLATVGLDAFTVAHIIHNHASTSNDDIYGSYTLL